MTSTPAPGGPAGDASAAGALRVLVIDDHRVFTELLSLALDASAGTRCVAVAAGIEEGLRKARAYAVDVIVIDVRLPDGSGIEAIPELLRVHPRARIVVLTAHPRADLAQRAIAAGASAFVAKEQRLADVVEAIHEARPERPLIRAPLPAAPANDLTPREQEVLVLLARGQDAAGIARQLGLSRHTVRDHVKAILNKLGVHSQLAAVSRAMTLGLVDA